MEKAKMFENSKPPLEKSDGGFQVPMLRPWYRTEGEELLNYLRAM